MAFSWTRLPDGPFAARDGHGLISFEGQLVLAGGWHPSDQINFPRRTNNEVWLCPNPTLPGTWTLQRRQAGWEPRHAFGLAAHSNGFLYLIGGDTQQGYYQNDVWDSGNGHIYRRLTSAAPWGPRVHALHAFFQGKLWVFGGQTLPQWALADPIFYRDGWSSTDGISWTQEADDLSFLPRGRIDRLVVHDGYLYAMGGGCTAIGNDPDTYLNDVWRSDDGVDWEQVLEEAPWAARRDASVASYDGKLWIAGGVKLVGGNDVNIADTWFSDDGVSWEEVATPWAARHAAGLAVHDGGLYLVSGNNLQPDVWVLLDEQPALANSVPLETFGSGISISSLGSDGTYTVSRTGGANQYGIGVTSTNAISGDYLLEYEPLSPAAAFNDYVGVDAAKANTGWTYADADYMIQVFTIVSGSADIWLNGSSPFRTRWYKKVYIERVGNTVNFYTAPNWTVAQHAGPVYSTADATAAAAYAGILVRDPSDSAKVRFIQHP